MAGRLFWWTTGGGGSKVGSMKRQEQRHNVRGLNAMKYSLPISPKYQSPIFETVAIQIVLGIFSLQIIDGGDCARICGIALVAFWGGATVLIWRRPQTPTKIDIQLIRFGFLPVAVLAFFLVNFIWHLRGL